MQPAKPNLRRRTILGTVLLLLIVVCFAVVWLLTAPPVGNVFSNVLGVTCIYRADVTAFEDLNGDGVQNPGEPALSGASVSITHSLPYPTTPSVEQALTDSNGKAQFNADRYCAKGDEITVQVAPPTGYGATTSTTFGPYPVPEPVYEVMTEVAKRPMPQFVVGFRKG